MPVVKPKNETQVSTISKVKMQLFVYSLTLLLVNWTPKMPSELVSTDMRD
jgi:hypothetical protein